jgi:hypothetical protein
MHPVGVVRMRNVAVRAAMAAVYLLACDAPVITNRAPPDGRGGVDAGARGTPDPVPGTDAGPAPPGHDGGAAPSPEDTRVDVPLDGRPLDIMPRTDLGDVAARMPRIADPWLRSVLESTDTLWYDRRSIVPGYQDSFGDNVTFPIGMRPNTIDPRLIVDGGHELVFAEVGRFHFPFGDPARSTEDDIAAVDFWHVPRDDAGAILPVVWWRWEPNGNTRRVEWMFPTGTVLGEVLYLIDGSGARWAFEIRVRVREATRFRVDVFRPFPTAEDFAAALERKRAGRPEWASSADVSALIAHARDPGTLVSGTLASGSFESAFPTLRGGEDVLPPLGDGTILRELLLETPFRSARGAVWKESGGLRAYAATTRAAFSIVPRDYAGGFLSVDEETCTVCHRDAGRPLRDWYTYVTAYGEMWGGDDTFTWHPFENGRFVDSRGSVVQFNTDNRAIRTDFIAAGLVERYDGSRHRAPVYTELDRPWKGFRY